MTPLADQPLGAHPKYEIVDQLGRGGMGTVYVARHRTLGTTVVVKVLNTELKSRPSLIDRMRLEAQALARLNHPNLVRVMDFDYTDDGRPYLVMDHLRGQSLRERLVARGGPLHPREALHIVSDALSGLQAAHDAGLIHRDIKLDNIFVCDTPQDRRPDVLHSPVGDVKLLDFGVAKVLSITSAGMMPLQFATEEGLSVGTPRFFSPEQAQGDRCDARSDIYSMGLVLYVLLAGQGPFDDRPGVQALLRAHIEEPPRPPSELHPAGLPAAIDEIVLRCLQKSPVKRYATAEELRERLLAVVSTLDERTATSPRSPTKSKRPRRHIQRLQLPSKGQNDRDSFAQPSSPRSTSSRHVLLPLSGATALWVLATTIALGALLAWAYKTWF